MTGIALHEGYRGQAYKDSVGVPTVGFGSTVHENGASVQPGDKTTPERALLKMNTHLDRTQKAMRACLGDVPLYPHEWDAYVSLAYNIGEHAFCRSTLAKHLQKTPPDYAAACGEILRWDKAGGKALKGLSKRREAEYRLCMEGYP